MNQLWLLGLFLNLFLFYSVFHIHFQSPVVEVDNVFRANTSSGVRRLVVFVGDGLRADSFYDQPDLRPYLTSVMDSAKGAWGISHTRVPTESRPGHVAIFSGLYEDPSAVFTGWKKNLVPFDSVFNRSSYGIALGSPDVVEMFRKGLYENHLYVKSYPSDWQDFLAANSSVLDTWVFDEFAHLIQTRTIPDQNELIIFLHLLGIDNTGHAMKPHSKEYNANIKLVDDIVGRVQTLVDSYFTDDRTLFLFTADHGMTDWGSHGSGSRAETETPFVMWGHGVKSLRDVSLKQADLAALMAGALNIPFPTNSVGQFPSHLWTNQDFAFEALRANFLQIKQLMKTKRELAKSLRRLPIQRYFNEGRIWSLHEEAIKLFKTENSERATQTLNEAIMLTLSGIDYYERYDRHLLQVCAVLVFVLWMALLVSALLLRLDLHPRLFYRKKTWTVLGVLSMLVTKGLIGWSLWRTLYLFGPLYLAELIWTLWRNEVLNGSVVARFKSFFPLLLAGFFGAEMLVNSIENRSMLTLGLFLNAIWSMKGKKLGTWQMVLWLGSTGVLGLFPLAPVIGKKQNLVFMTSGPLVAGTLAVLLLRLTPTPESLRDRYLVYSQTALLFSVSVLIQFPTWMITRVVSWTSILLSLLAPSFASASNLPLRLVSIFVGICTPFSLLSLSHESMFLPVLFLTLLQVLKFETTSSSSSQEVVTWRQYLSSQLSLDSTIGSNQEARLHQAFKISWFHLFFIYLSFFGIGNIASVSSFDPTATRCFVSIFSPFVMMIALLEKILGPFLLVSCIFRLLLRSKAQVEQNFLIVLLLCQVMALHTFFQVRTTGSWLEIGTSISHYVIVQSTTLFIFLLHFVSNFLISVSLLGSSSKRQKPMAVIQTHRPNVEQFNQMFPSHHNSNKAK